MNYDIFDRILDAVFIINNKKEIIYCNEAAATLCQTNIKRLSDKFCYEVLTLDRSDLFWMGTGQLGESQPSNYIECHFTANSGACGTCQVNIEPLVDEQHQTEKNWIIFVRDVSLEETLQNKYKKELEAKTQAFQILIEAQEQVVEISKMVTLGQFVADVSEQLTIPLGTLLNSVEAQKEKLVMGLDKVAPLQLAETMTEAAHDMVKILRNIKILIHEQTDSAEMSFMNIYDILASAIKSQKRLSTKSDVAVLLDCSRGLPKIKCNPELLEQLATNLIKNSLDAHIESETIRPKIEVKVWFDQELNHLIILFQDNGPGIAAKNRDKVFKSFFTTKAKGTGLGLTICQRAVERHNGKIQLIDSQEEGAQFLVVLPMTALSA